MQETYQAVIVEDDPMIASIDQNFLERDPRFHLAASFRSGQDALPWLLRHPADLLILDVYMPRMTGLELLRELRSFGITSDVVMVTAANDSKIAESFRQIEDKKEFLQYLKKAQKQKEIGLWLITEPVDATTKKEELLGVALSVSDEETVFYALTHEKEPEGQLSLFAEAVESVDDTAEITEALQ